MSDAAEKLPVFGKLNNSVNLCFHLAYNSRHFGADYGKKYHSDPVYRVETDMKVAKGLYQQFGKYGMGSADPKPSPGVGIQPLDFMNGAMGGKMVYKENTSVETPDKPLSGIETIEEVQNLADIDWETSSLLRNCFEQAEKIQQAYPDFSINEIQSVWQEGEGGQESFLTMHTPYTTAFRLFGQEILEKMMLEEDFAEAIFEWLMRQYQSLWDTICKKKGWKGNKVHFGDCAATMLSPKIYERMCLPLYQRLMENFEHCVIHSCGQSSHLLELFAQVPKVRQLQLGHGTDLAKARKLFPNSYILAYYEPWRLMTDSPAEIEKELWKMTEELGDKFDIGCGGADPDTPQENVYAFLETAKKINA